MKHRDILDQSYVIQPSLFHGMSRSKRHHFVPAFYLAGFTSDNSQLSPLYCFDLKRYMARQSRPPNEGYRRNEHDDRFEQILGAHDSRCAPILRKLSSGSFELSKIELLNLINFAACQIIRVPTFRDRIRTEFPEIHIKKMMIFSTKLFLVAETFTHGAYQKPGETIAIEAYYPKGDGLVEFSRRHSSYEEVLNFGYHKAIGIAQIQDLIEKVVEGRHLYMGSDSQNHPYTLDCYLILEAIPGLIINAEWKLLTTGSSNKQFILSDSPVYVGFSNLSRDSRGMAIELMLPLTKNAALLGRIGAGDAICIEATADSIENINAVTIRNAERFLYSATPLEDPFKSIGRVKSAV